METAKKAEKVVVDPAKKILKTALETAASAELSKIENAINHQLKLLNAVSQNYIAWGLWLLRKIIRNY